MDICPRQHSHNFCYLINNVAISSFSGKKINVWLCSVQYIIITLSLHLGKSRSVISSCCIKPFMPFAWSDWVWCRNKKTCVIHWHIYTVSFVVLEAVLQRCSYENVFWKICSKFKGECPCTAALSKSHLSVGVLLGICCIFLNTLS